jgi:predicted HicB family RNase H-like nuclease
MAKSPEKTYINTTISTDLVRSIKVLAAQKGIRLNQLLEEAIQDLLKKYEKKIKK